MKIGLVQYSPQWENTEANIVKINNLIEARDKDYDILIFPEMTLTGFTMKSAEYAEEIDGISTSYFIALAQKLKKHIFAGIIENDEGKIFNSLVHFDDKGLITARYRKVHPYSNAGEDKSYSAGRETVITKIDNSRVGLTICYDLRFPELYRLYCKEGIDILINIASWPVPRIDHWRTLLKARAIENQCFMVGVNRTGNDPKNEYNGFSSINDPLGNLILSVEKEEGIFSAELDLSRVQDTRENLPFLKDMKLI